MSLLDQLQKDMITAMKAHDKDTLSVVRMLKSAVKTAQIDAGHELSRDEELDVLNHEMKQRKESLADFQKAGRQDLVDKTNAEIKVVAKYLPAQMSEDEVKDVVSSTLKSINATSMKDFGKAMGAVMGKLKGKADGKLVNKLVKAELQ